MAKNYHSLVVEAAHEIFALKRASLCGEVLDKYYAHFPDRTKDIFRHFSEKLRNWILYQHVEEKRKALNIRAFTHELDEIIQDLARMQKVLKPTLQRFETSRENSRQLIRASIRKIEKLEEDLVKTQDLKQIKNITKQITELRIENDREIKKAEEEQRNLERRCDQLVRQEQHLIKHLEAERILRSECLAYASEQDIPKPVALEVYGFSIESHFFTYLSPSEYEKLMANSELGVQTKLKDFFIYNESDKVYELKKNLHYHSIFLERNLIGDKKNQSGISYLDKQLKQTFLNRLQHLDFRDYHKDALQFFHFVCDPALEDGIMTREEVNQMLDLSSALKLNKLDSLKVIDAVAIDTQKRLIKNHLQDLFSLALSDNEVHKAEQHLILEIKTLLLNSIKTNFSTLMNCTTDIHLLIDDEEIFMQLCRIAKADDKFLDVEKIFIAEFAKSKKWSTEKVQELAVKSNYATKVDKELKSDIWSLYGAKTPFN